MCTVHTTTRGLASLDLSQNDIPASEANLLKTECEAKDIALKLY